MNILNVRKKPIRTERSKHGDTKGENNFQESTLSFSTFTQHYLRLRDIQFLNARNILTNYNFFTKKIHILLNRLEK